eukprot:Gb_18178 [translate_table: standard]
METVVALNNYVVPAPIFTRKVPAQGGWALQAGFTLLQVSEASFSVVKGQGRHRVTRWQKSKEAKGHWKLKGHRNLRITWVTYEKSFRRYLHKEVGHYKLDSIFFKPQHWLEGEGSRKAQSHQMAKVQRGKGSLEAEESQKFKDNVGHLCKQCN